MGKCPTSWAWSRVSSFEKIHEGMAHILIRWNQHNMSSYGIWGSWQRWRNYVWKVLGKQYVKKERKDHGRCNYSHRKSTFDDQKDWSWHLHREEDRYKVCKESRPLTYEVLEMCLWMCRMMQASKCHDERPSQKLWFDVHFFYFEQHLDGLI